MVYNYKYTVYPYIPEFRDTFWQSCLNRITLSQRKGSVLNAHENALLKKACVLPMPGPPNLVAHTFAFPSPPTALFSCQEQKKITGTSGYNRACDSFPSLMWQHKYMMIVPVLSQSSLSSNYSNSELTLGFFYSCLKVEQRNSGT